MVVKNYVKVLSLLLVLVFAFGICACDDITEGWKYHPEESSSFEAKYPLEGESGCYYGTRTETLYWYQNKEETEECKCFVFEYNGCYYFWETKNPEHEAREYQSIGPEKYFANLFDGERYKAFNGSYDASSKTSTYMIKSKITDTQYLLKTYTLKFDGNGGLSGSCKTMQVYASRDEAEPYETATFTLKKK